LALVNVIGADGQTASGFGGAARTSQSGRTGMNGVVEDTRRGVAAIAPSTDTPAGKRQLVDHLQSQLDRAKALLTVSEQRNVMLAQMIRGGAAGYRGGSPMAGAMPPMMGAGRGATSPTSLGGIPNLSAMMPNLSSLTRLGANPRSGAGLDTFGASAHSRAAVVGGPLAQMAAKAALSKQGAPYIWGAKGPNTFDGSGLTGWAWCQAGSPSVPTSTARSKQGIPRRPRRRGTGRLDARHLDDPATVVISDLFIQAWGRKPNAHNAGRRQPVAVPV
jgi:cell wall-associated NlpC family hydrolase